MPRIIFKCPYIKGGTERTAAHLSNYVKYMATRDGVDMLQQQHADLPATEKQRRMVNQLLRDFPLSKGMFEYEDYLAAPTRENASDFITRALEDNYDRIEKRENYLKYIATRPRAQRIGAHGLFTGTDGLLALSQVAEEVAHHQGNVWLPIISLRREDAARLGYDDAENWRALLTGCAMEMSKSMKIPWERFRWYASFHDESHHPHVHMVCYSTDPSKGFLTKQGIADIKSMLAKEIFRQELTELYQRQTLRRDELSADARTVLKQLIEQMQSGTVDNPRLEQLMTHLAERLQFLSGKKQYGYLKEPLKVVVDEIVDELAKDPRVAAAYELWYELREDVLHSYRDDLPERLPLSRQKEFKNIKNIVIAEAVRLGGPPPPTEERTLGQISHAAECGDEAAQHLLRKIANYGGHTWNSPQPPADRKHERSVPYGTSTVYAVTKILHHLANIFQERTPPPPSGGMRVSVDRKLLRKIKAKKIAQGHKADDHEPKLNM